MAKLRRVGVSADRVRAFIELLELNRVPNIGEGVATGIIDVGVVLALRRSREAVKFRAWLRKVDVKDARELEQEFVSSITKTAPYASLPMRTVRFAILQTLGILEPVSGTALQYIDSFHVERWLAGYNPRLLMDQMRALPKKQEGVD